MWCLSQVCHKIYKTKKQTKTFKTHRIMWKTTKKYEHTLWTQLYYNKIHTGLELWWNWVWYKYKMVLGHIYLQAFFRWMNVEGANRKVSTIILNVTCPYPIRWEILLVTHCCAPSKYFLPIYLLQHTTGVNIPPPTIQV